MRLYVVTVSFPTHHAVFNAKENVFVCSAGLTIVANVAIATGPALLGAPRSFILNLFLLYARVGIII